VLRPVTRAAVQKYCLPLVRVSAPVMRNNALVVFGGKAKGMFFPLQWGC
jgi:hypothetical protein